MYQNPWLQMRLMELHQREMQQKAAQYRAAANLTERRPYRFLPWLTALLDGLKLTQGLKPIAGTRKMLPQP